MTIREALAEGSAALAEASAAGTSALDASLLLASILNTSRSSLLAADSRPLDEASLAAFPALVKRRLAGECVAYIVGRKEFYGLDFQVTPAVLVPRPDTETLVEAALGVINEWGAKGDKLAEVNQPLRVLDCMRRTEGSETNTLPKQEPVRVLDLCTGSGAVAIALKYTMPELEVWATDISAEALAVARANAARLLPPDSIHFCHGDLFGALPPAPQSGAAAPPFHLIVSNPPYVPAAEIAALAPEVRGEPHIALNGGDDGLAVIRRIISGAPQFLGSNGALLLEADPRQMERIAALLQQAGFTDIQTRRDLSGTERVIGGKFSACHT
jgi:release factor glutamine methyltransferase